MQLKEYENIKLYHGDCIDLMRETPDKYYDIALVAGGFNPLPQLRSTKK